ncbi:hypothetical protein [Streptomyces galilaeus]|uniref:hypothetical protein n=1 Tax=Streptomyces galilaeus TaxID=33899 RepID=UPI0038F66466
MIEDQGDEASAGRPEGVLLGGCEDGALRVRVGQPKNFDAFGAASLAQQEQQLPGEGGAQWMLLVHAQQRHAQFAVTRFVAIGGQQLAVLAGDLLPDPLVGPGGEVTQPGLERLLSLPAGLVEEDQLLLLLP